MNEAAAGCKRKRTRPVAMMDKFTAKAAPASAVEEAEEYC